MNYQAIPDEKVIYGLNGKGKLLVLALFLVLAAFFLVMINIKWTEMLDAQQNLSDLLTYLPSYLPFIVVFCFVNYLLISVWQCRLEVSAEGIVSYSGSYKEYTPWNNIIGVVVGPFSAAPSAPQCTFLQLRQKVLMSVRVSEGKQRRVAVIEKSWWLPKNAFFARLDKIILTNALLTFPYNDWQTSEFAQYFQQYAPEAYRNSLASVGEL